MVCEIWNGKLDLYLDGEMKPDEMRVFDAHVRSCPSCTADVLAGVQMKRAVQIAGKRFTPGAEFRQRVERSVAAKRRRTVGFSWMTASAVVAIVIVVGLAAAYIGRERFRTQQVYSEIADLHVATLASSSPVDVVSSDRHTVKPWFQGKIPFTFDLPELQNSEFSLLGGRMTYLEQTPGAHLIYELRKHRISVFIFPEEGLRGRFGDSSVTKRLSFSVETWNRGGLRYFAIGDAGGGDIDRLAKLFKDANP
ncbi:MAG: zf-HC2 domain-containing protein [Candidatus Sulfotelmatobacter sp.]